MRKNRITALLLSVVLAVTFSLSNVQTSQAAAVAITPQMIEVLYAILGSAGAIAVTNGTGAEKKDVIKTWSGAELPRVVGGMELIAAFETDENMNYRYQGNLKFEDVKRILEKIYNSFVKYLGSAVLGRHFTLPDVSGYELCKDWAIGTESGANWRTFATGSDMYVIDGFDGSSVQSVYGVGADGYGIRVSGLSYGRLSYGSGHGRYFGKECEIRYSTRTEKNGHRVFSWQFLSSDGSVYTSASNGQDPSSTSFTILFGNGKAFGAGLADVPRLLSTIRSLSGTVDTGIDCDVWADALGRSLVDENKDVVILGGQDLANYNDVTTVREGLITGVDWADIGEPDIPIDPDAPAKPDAPAGNNSILRILKKILEWLKDILEWLKGLPALLAETIIGDGVLDWSGFQGVQLSSVFPFCIPWDLVSCVRSFNVQPTEPVFVFDFAGTPLSSAGTVRYDLSRFAVVIPIIRYFIYGIFVVGLIVKTRDLIRG